MNNVEIEDIHHHDFTSVTEWEVFIAGLEVIIHDWKLTHSKVEPPLEDNDFVNLNWVEKYDKINFAGKKKIIIYFCFILSKLKSTKKNSYIMFNKK